MLYLTGCIPKKPELQRLLLEESIGAMLTPFSQRSIPSSEWVWAVPQLGHRPANPNLSWLAHF